MAHEAYGPVGYDYNADHYCLDCIPNVAAKPNTYGLDEHGKRRVMERFGGNGTSRTECNCTECRLDRMAKARGINRMDESSFDSGEFPKAIPYFNDLHCECGPEGYGYGPEDPEWREQYCNATCAKCHAVIDGTVLFNSEEVCPVWHSRKENDFK